MGWRNVASDDKKFFPYPDFNFLIQYPNKLLKYHLHRVWSVHSSQEKIEKEIQEVYRKHLVQLWKEKKLSDYHFIKFWLVDKGIDKTAPENQERIKQASQSFQNALCSSPPDCDKPFVQAAKLFPFFSRNKIPLSKELKTSDQRIFTVENKLFWAKEVRSLRKALLGSDSQEEVKCTHQRLELLDRLLKHEDISEEIPSLQEGLSLYSDFYSLNCPRAMQGLNSCLKKKFLTPETAFQFLDIGLQYKDLDLINYAREILNAKHEKIFELRFDPRRFKFQLIIKQFDENLEKFCKNYSDHIFGMAIFNEKINLTEIAPKLNNISLIEEVCIPNITDPRVFGMLGVLFSSAKHCCINQNLLKNVHYDSSYSELIKNSWRHLKSLELIFLTEKESSLQNSWDLSKQIRELFPSQPSLFFSSWGRSKGDYISLDNLSFQSPILQGDILKAKTKSSDRLNFYINEVQARENKITNGATSRLGQFAKIIEIYDDAIFSQGYLKKCPNAEVVKIKNANLDITAYGSHFPNAKVLYLPLSFLYEDHLHNQFKENWKNLTHMVLCCNVPTDAEEEQYIQGCLNALPQFVPDTVKKVIITDNKKCQYVPAAQNLGKYEIFWVDKTSYVDGKFTSIKYDVSLGDSPDELLLEVLLQECTNPEDLLKTYQGKITDITFEGILEAKKKQSPRDPSFYTLELKNGEFNDEGIIRKLRNWQRLKSLKFLHCSGLEKNAWEAIGKLQNLELLDLTGTPIALEDLDNLKKRLPSHCKIITSENPSLRSGQPKMQKT